MSKLTLSFKGKVLKIFPVLKGSMMLGSDPSCTIHIDSLALQPQHAQIDTVENDSVIRDLGTEEGTFIGETKVEGMQPLKDGDVIRVGNTPSVMPSLKILQMKLMLLLQKIA